MRIPIAREGLWFGIVPLLIAISGFLFESFIFSGVFFVIALFNFFFFREPYRALSPNPAALYAPCDGRVVQIREEFEDEIFKQTVNKVSIFMSIFNVHVNNSPINGKVNYIKYNRGAFRKADLIGQKETNENNFVGIINDYLQIGVRQVAGLIARRIVCNTKVGNELKAGEKFGLIRYGSRVDVYIPKDWDIKVSVGQTVRSISTVLASKTS